MTEKGHKSTKGFKEALTFRMYSPWTRSMPSSKWERKGVAVCSLDHKRKESRCSVILEISKSTRRSFVLVALVCLLLYRLPGRSKLSLVQYSSYGQRSARQINENTLGNSSFLIPESYTTRYPQLENRTAAESVAAEYKQTALQANSSEYDPLASCSVTSQVRVVQNNPLWILESIDAKGNPKTVGGDEFYVTYRDDIVAKATEVTAAAFIDDLGDGTYSLDFVTTPMNPIPSNLTGRGTLTVNFQYSCGIGKAHQPVKDKWTMGGATFIRHSAANVTQPLIRKCERPTNAIDLRTFDKVIAFGDSIMEQQFILKGSNLKKQIKEQYFRPNVYWRENPASELVNAKLFRFMTKLESWHGEDLLNSSNTALIVGSAIWDIIAKKTNSVGPGFTDHLDTCRSFIEVIRELYPTVTVIWKAPTAMHIHRVDRRQCIRSQQCIRRLRYCSGSRVEYLREQQLRIMKELNVPVMDTFHATYLSESHYKHGDVMHYLPYLNELLLEYFYKDDPSPSMTAPSPA